MFSLLNVVCKHTLGQYRDKSSASWTYKSFKLKQQAGDSSDRVQGSKLVADVSVRFKVKVAKFTSQDTWNGT